MPEKRINIFLMSFFQSFLPVIGDNLVANDGNVQRVILCSGKHYYALNEERLTKKYEDVAIVRVESLCPFPVAEINQELEKYKNAKSAMLWKRGNEKKNNFFDISVVIWSQEEHKNMGAWTFVKPRFENMCGRKVSFAILHFGGHFHDHFFVVRSNIMDDRKAGHRQSEFHCGTKPKPLMSLKVHLLWCNENMKIMVKIEDDHWDNLNLRD